MQHRSWMIEAACSVGGMILTGEHRNTRRKPCTCATSFATNPTWNSLAFFCTVLYSVCIWFILVPLSWWSCILPFVFTYITHIHAPTGFEPAIPASDRQQTLALMLGGRELAGLPQPCIITPVSGVWAVSTHLVRGQRVRKIDYLKGKGYGLKRDPWGLWNWMTETWKVAWIIGDREAEYYCNPLKGEMRNGFFLYYNRHVRYQ